MNQVMSLAIARTDLHLQRQQLTHDDLSDRIDLVAHRYVPLGAVVLLRQIILLTRQGYEELSYTFLERHLGITRPTIAKYFMLLEEEKFLKIRRSRVGLTNAVNRFEISFNGPLGEEMALKTPKRDRRNIEETEEKDTENDPKGVVKNFSGVVKNFNGYINNTNSRNKVPKGTKRCAPASFESIEEAKSKVAARTAAKREEKVTRQRKAGTQLTLQGIKATWATSMLKHYPSVPSVVLSQKDLGVFKNQITPFLSTTNLSALFDYFVGNWDTLRQTKFGWLRAKGKDVAQAPSIPELMRYWKVFAQAYADSRMIEHKSSKATERNRERELEDELRQVRAKAAAGEQESAKLRERLQTAERIAYSGKKPKPTRSAKSLSQRQAELPDLEDDDLPEWT